MKVLKLKSRARIHAIWFAPDGAILLTDNRRLLRVDTDSGETSDICPLNAALVVPHPGTHRVAISQTREYSTVTGRLAAVGLMDTRASNSREWTRLPLRDSERTSDPFGGVMVYGLAFAPRGDVVAVAYRDSSPEGRVRLLGTDNAEPRQTLTFPRPVQCVALDSGGSWLTAVVGYWNQMRVQIHRLGDSAPVSAFTPGRGRVQKVLFAGDDSLLIGLAGARLFVARPDQQPVVTAPVDHRGPLRDVAVSPDGRLAVTVGDDRRARTWMAATASLVSVADWQIGPLTAVAFAPDGLTCAAGGENGQIVVWDVDI